MMSPGQTAGESDDETTYDYEPIIGLISTKDKITIETTITANNHYYIDLIDKTNHIIGDLDEDIKVWIKAEGAANYIEYPVTRNFYDHANAQLANIGEVNNLDPIFVLTIPDYGIRLFKKGYIDQGGNVIGYFPINGSVKVECYKYTTDSQVNMDEFNKITIPGTETIKLELINNIEREDGNALLYNANSAQRTSKSIRSNSDVAVLFSEYFINDILYSNIRFNQAGTIQTEGGNQLDTTALFVFYVPRDEEYEIPRIDQELFIDAYKNYLITENLLAYSGACNKVQLALKIELSDTNDITPQIREILAEYENKLTNRSNLTEEQIEQDDLNWDTAYYSELVDINELRSKIAKLPTVVAISVSDINSQEIYLSGVKDAEIEGGDLVTSWYDAANQVRVPVYYQFELLVNYTYKYESVSKR
jgi:hypothetical protein